MDKGPQHDVAGWILAGGEGRRMGGVNKGLQPYRGQALVLWSMDCLQKQTVSLNVNANKDQAQYEHLLRKAHPTAKVFKDDEDISGSLGPMAGILTGLRHAQSRWLMVAPCDTPSLPHTLVAQLLQNALATQTAIAVPQTHTLGDKPQPHWTCALMDVRRVMPSLEAALCNGERRLGKWIQTLPWISVSFDNCADFKNINTTETLHGKD